MAKTGLFTDRQRQVVSLIAAGCTNPEIAEYLNVSPRTAKAHCDVLRQKLGVQSRRQIPVAYLVMTGDDPLQIDLGRSSGDARSEQPWRQPDRR